MPNARTRRGSKRAAGTGSPSPEKRSKSNNKSGRGRSAASRGSGKSRGRGRGQSRSRGSAVAAESPSETVTTNTKGGVQEEWSVADISKMFEIKDTEIDSKIIEDNGGVENGGARQAKFTTKTMEFTKIAQLFNMHKGANEEHAMTMAKANSLNEVEKTKRYRT